MGELIYIYLKPGSEAAPNPSSTAEGRQNMTAIFTAGGAGKITS